MQFFECEKYFVSTNFKLRLKKKNFGGNFKKKFVVAIKKMLVIQFPYKEFV